MLHTEVLFQVYSPSALKLTVCILFDSRVIFSVKEGEFADLVRGGEDAVFVKSKEDNLSRKERL